MKYFVSTNLVFNDQSKVDHSKNIVGDGDHESQGNIPPHKPNDYGENDGVDQLAIELHVILYIYYFISVARQS